MPMSQPQAIWNWPKMARYTSYVQECSCQYVACEPNIFCQCRDGPAIGSLVLVIACTLLTVLAHDAKQQFQIWDCVFDSLVVCSVSWLNSRGSGRQHSFALDYCEDITQHNEFTSTGSCALCLAGKSAKSMARGGQGLPREMGGDPLDLLDAGTSRKMVKHAAARGTARAAGEEEDDFEQADDGKMIIRVLTRFEPVLCVQLLACLHEK